MKALLQILKKLKFDRNGMYLLIKQRPKTFLSYMDITGDSLRETLKLPNHYIYLQKRGDLLYEQKLVNMLSKLKKQHTEVPILVNPDFTK